MKAFQFHQYGPPKVLQLEEVERPRAGPKQVLIKVMAATVTAGDCEMRRFQIGFLYWLPLRLFMGIFSPRIKILGQELSGEIVEVGKEVTQFNVGDKIFTASGPSFGAYAQYKCLPGKYAMLTMPVNLTFEEAATIPTGGLNALCFIRKVELKEGDKVLINGAGGSIGTYAVQLAKYFKAEVTAIDRGDKLEMLRSLGADHVIDYTKEDFRQNGLTYDVIIDIVGKGWLSRNVRSLNPSGRYLIANPGLRTIALSIWTKLTNSRKVMNALAPYKKEDLIYLRKLVEEGVLKPVIDKIFPFEELVEAHRYVETGHKAGHVVIAIDHNDLR